MYPNYLGSQWTYPLLDPFTSFTTSSKVSKSRAVTASNATSNKIKDHSKKAYVVYAGDYVRFVPKRGSGYLTSCDFVDLVLNKEVYQGN
jgi:hypothetical protein